MSALHSSPAWREATRLLRRHRRPLTVALLLVALGRLAALVLPNASRYVVDVVIARHRSDLLWPIALIAGAAIAIETVAAFGMAQVAGVSGQRAVAELRQGLQDRVLGLPLRYTEASHRGALAARVLNDPEQVRYLVGNGLVQLLASTFTAALALGFLFWLNASLTLGVLAIVALAAFNVRRAFGPITVALEGILKRQSELTGRFGQVLGGLRVVKAYVAERHEAYRFALESHRLVRESVDVLGRISFLSAGGTLAAGALGVLVLVAGGRAVATGAMSLGSYVMYVWLTGYLLGPVLHIAASAGDMGKAVAALTRIGELRELATEEEEDRSRRRLPRMVGTVDFESVSYGYASERLALRGVSFHVPAGSLTALVGANGSGKSTLCRLLLAYDRPTAGRILIDGRDLASLHRRSCRTHFGVVLQDDMLFDGPIRDNIRYGRPDASPALVEAAGRLAQCDEFVARLPHGYATRVGERGLGLSAGQRQRVIIARALLVDPRILVLDEATSSLDAESEDMIQDALRFLCRGRTTFVIAHRLATMRNADQILVLDRGILAERGTHDELVAQGGRYFDLWNTRPHDTAERLVVAGDWKADGFAAGRAKHAIQLAEGERGNGNAC